MGKSREQRGLLFHRGKEIERSCYRQKPIGVNWELKVQWLLIA